MILEELEDQIREDEDMSETSDLDPQIAEFLQDIADIESPQLLTARQELKQARSKSNDAATFNIGEDGYVRNGYSDFGAGSSPVDLTVETSCSSTRRCPGSTGKRHKRVEMQHQLQHRSVRDRRKHWCAIRWSTRKSSCALSLQGQTSTSTGHWTRRRSTTSSFSTAGTGSRAALTARALSYAAEKAGMGRLALRTLCVRACPKIGKLQQEHSATPHMPPEPLII